MRRPFFNRKEHERPETRRLGWRVVLIGLLLSAVAGTCVFFGLLYARMPVPDLARLRAGQHPYLGLPTVVYSADDRELARFYRENRAWVRYAQISPHVVEALVATEDHRFYRHGGVDWIRLAASVWKTARGRRQGGSTITMQLVRNFFPDVGHAPALRRKLYEIVAALKIERAYLKHEILELYLNTVPFGYQAFGIEAAALTYFNKHAALLSEIESATLVGMLQATTRYNPVRNPSLSRQRRNVVLGQMVRYGVLSPDASERLRREPLLLDFQFNNAVTGPAPHFAAYVRAWLNDWAARSGYDLYADGLTVHTTLDSRLQELARSAVETRMRGLQAVAGYEWSRRKPALLGDDPAVYEKIMATGRFKAFDHLWRARPDLLEQHLRRTPRYRRALEHGAAPDSLLRRLRADTAFLDSLRTAVTRLETGFVALDPGTGRVLAWVGGRDFALDQYDKVALARRQPGSTFKPFVYAAALEAGRSADEQREDVIRSYGAPDEAGPWTPTNAGGGASGDLVTLREGLVFSKNTVTAQLVDEMGPAWVAHVARRMGIRSELAEVPSLALGTSEVTLLEMAAAYGPFATHGVFHEPFVVTRIEDRNGQVVASFAPAAREALSRYTAYTVLDMMREVVDRGTGTRIRSQFDIEADVAGKTGTTQNNADGWFILMHPRLVMGAWVGFNDRQISFRTDFWGQGAHNALYIVGDFFRQALDAGLYRPDERFSPPRGYLAAAPSANPDSLTGESLRMLTLRYDTAAAGESHPDLEGSLRSALNRFLYPAADSTAAPGATPDGQAPLTPPPPGRSEGDLEQTLRRMLFSTDPPAKDTSQAPAQNPDGARE